MIPLLVAVALAEPRGDVYVQYPAFQSVPATYATVDDAGLETAASPDLRFDLGLGTAWELGKDPRGGLLLSGGADLWSRTWTHEPEDFGVAVWDGWVGLGWRGRGEPIGPARVQAWVDGSVTLHTQLLLPTWYDGVVTTTPGMNLGMGTFVGRGPVRPTVGAQAGFVLGNARTSGMTSNTPDGFSWSWHASRAWVRLQAGVSFGRAAEPAPSPAP